MPKQDFGAVKIIKYQIENFYYNWHDSLRCYKPCEVSTKRGTRGFPAVMDTETRDKTGGKLRSRLVGGLFQHTESTQYIAAFDMTKQMSKES